MKLNSDMQAEYDAHQQYLSPEVRHTRRVIFVLRVVVFSWLAWIFVSLLGCGGPECPVEAQIYTPYGIGVYVEAEGASEWAYRYDLPTRLDRLVDVVAAYAGRDPGDLLGWVVVIRADDHVPCGDHEAVDACTHYAGRWIEQSLQAYPCIEQSSLAHELLHALGLHGHSDPRWRDWTSVATQLNSYDLTWTSQTGEHGCDVVPEMWITTLAD